MTLQAREPLDEPKIYEERFWSKVPRYLSTEACWPWQGAKKIGNTGPYGYLAVRYGPRIEGKQYKLPAHRLSWALAHGHWPKQDELIRHLCHNPECVNPLHLTVGSHEDNMADMAQARRSTIGERNTKAKLTESQVLQVLALRREGHTLKYIAQQFGVHLATIGYICQGKIWRYVEADHARQTA